MLVGQLSASYRGEAEVACRLRCSSQCSVPLFSARLDPSHRADSRLRPFASQATLHHSAGAHPPLTHTWIPHLFRLDSRSSHAPGRNQAYIALHSCHHSLRRRLMPRDLLSVTRKPSHVASSPPACSNSARHLPIASFQGKT